MSHIQAISRAAALAMLAACAPGSDLPEVTQLSQIAPPGAGPGTCWARAISPAVIETVTQQVMVTPPRLAADGSVLTPAVYATETRQDIVREREPTWFQTPCADQITPDLIASLQRALTARGHYSGPVTARIDTPTRAAILAYQKTRGLESADLSLESARSLGLLAIRPDAAG